MTLDSYISNVLSEFSTATGSEVTGVRTVEFDIGVYVNDANYVLVSDDSNNRIRFTLEVKRA